MTPSDESRSMQECFSCKTWTQLQSGRFCHRCLSDTRKIDAIADALKISTADRDRLAERVEELEAKLTNILQVHHQSQSGGADGRWWYRYSVAMHEAEKLLGWPTTKPDEPAIEQEQGFSDLFLQVEKEEAGQRALTQRLAGMARITDEFVQLLQNCEAVSEENHEQLVTRTLPVLCDKFIKAQQVLEGKEALHG